MQATQSIPRTLLRSNHPTSSSNGLFQCLNQTPSITRQHQIRSVSSNRRTQKALRVQPTDHFTATTETSDHIIFNPPSSAPNVYHTPTKFLPPHDRRRQLQSLARDHFSSSSSSSSHSPSSSTSPTKSTTTKLPPSIRPIVEKKYHLTPSDVAEIRRLRAEDPKTWTRVRLAEKFGCSQFFVSLCGSAPGVAEERQRELEGIKKRWGRAKTEAREDRQRRKELWGRE